MGQMKGEHGTYYNSRKAGYKLCKYWAINEFWEVYHGKHWLVLVGQFHERQAISMKVVKICVHKL